VGGSLRLEGSLVVVISITIIIIILNGSQSVWCSSNGYWQFRACNAATGHKRWLWDLWNNEYFGFVKTELSCHMN